MQVTKLHKTTVLDEVVPTYIPVMCQTFQNTNCLSPLMMDSLIYAVENYFNLLSQESRVDIYFIHLLFKLYLFKHILIFSKDFSFS